MAKIKPKKRNCKDGLTNQQEIEARKIRKSILAGQKSPYYEQVKAYYTVYKSGNTSVNPEGFEDFVKQVNLTLYSALKRMKVNFMLFAFTGELPK